MNISKISVAVRMNAYAILALLSVLLIAGFSLSGVRELARTHEHSSGHFKAATFAAQGSSLAAETYQVMADTVINRKLDEGARNLDAIKTKARQMFARLQSNAETDEQKYLVGKAMQAHANMVTLFEQEALPLLRQTHPDIAAILAVDAEIDKQGGIIKDSLAQFSEAMSQTAIAADKDFEATQGDVFLHDEAIAAAIFALLLVASWLITRSLLKQLGGEPLHLAEVLHKMAGGDMTVDIRLVKGDRTSVLAKVKEMSDRFSQIMSSIDTAKHSLERAAAQVGFAAQILSESSSKQTAQSIATTSSINEMTVSIVRNRKNANTADNLAMMIAREVAKEKQAANDTVCSIKNIASKIENLSQLTNQSKLLVLDALVEAARAGQHGSRFKSVAENICELIERSQQVIKEITGLTCDSVNMAAKVGNLIDELEPNLTMTSDLAQEVSCSSSEQSRGVAQIYGAIGHLYQATQQNAFASEQLVVTAEEMSSLSDQLHNAMLLFKFDKVVIQTKKPFGQIPNLTKTNIMKAISKQAA